MKTGEQHTVETSHILLIVRPNSTHPLVNVLVPVVSIFELTNAVLYVSSDWLKSSWLSLLAWPGACKTYISQMRKNI